MEKVDIVCKNCGYSYGDHRALDQHCPISENSSFEPKSCINVLNKDRFFSQVKELLIATGEDTESFFKEVKKILESDKLNKIPQKGKKVSITWYDFETKKFQECIGFVRDFNNFRIILSMDLFYPYEEEGDHSMELYLDDIIDWNYLKNDSNKV